MNASRPIPFNTAAFLAAALLAGCSSLPGQRPHPPTPGPPADAVVPEAFVTANTADEVLDSLTTWPTEDGGTWLIATAKASHRLLVFDADNGTHLRTVGEKGEALGQFKRPNGMQALGNLLFVVERDNHRVQVLTLPDFIPLAVFGESVLRSPYDIWVHEIAPGEYDAYITDNFMYGHRRNRLPDREELAERIKRFNLHIDLDSGVPDARFIGAFGDTAPDTALRMVESIAGDPANDHLLIADTGIPNRNDRRAPALHEYTLAGHHAGRRLPTAMFGGAPGDIALWDCRDGEGYWVAADPRVPLTVFHLFDRHTLEHQGSFEGETASYTDGVVLHPAATRAFTGGALYAVHAGKAIAAFDLREIARMLDLTSSCTE